MKVDKLSQAEVGRRAARAASDISRLLQGKRGGQRRLLADVCYALDIPIQPGDMLLSVETGDDLPTLVDARSAELVRRLRAELAALRGELLKVRADIAAEREKSALLVKQAERATMLFSRLLLAFRE